MSSLEELFCSVDDWCQQFEPQWQKTLLEEGTQKRHRPRALCLSEIRTILIGFHQQHYRDFKHDYLHHVCLYWREAFPTLVSYNLFVEWMPSTLLLLWFDLKHCFSNCTGISFIDSTSIKVCHNRRISRHRVFTS